MTHQDSIIHVFAKYLLETDGGKLIATKKEGPLVPGLKTVIMTKPIFCANNTGKFRKLNHGVYAGKFFGTPITKDSVDISLYKLS